MKRNLIRSQLTVNELNGVDEELQREDAEDRRSLVG